MAQFIPSQPVQVNDSSNVLINPAKEDGHLATVDTSTAGTKTAVDSINTKTPSLGQSNKAGSVPITLASDQDPISVTSTPNFATRSDTFTTTGNGTTVTKTSAPITKFSVQVTGTAASATLWDVRLEGSLNGVTFTTILQHTNTSGDGSIQWSGSIESPSLYFRSRCAGLTLGGASNIVVTILGM